MFNINIVFNPDTSTWSLSPTGTTTWTWLEQFTPRTATSTLARLTSTPGRKSLKHNHLPLVQLVQPARHHRHPPCILAGDKASPTMAGPPKVLILAYLIIYPRLFWHECCMRVCNVYIFSFLVLAPFSPFILKNLSNQVRSGILSLNRSALP